MSTREQLQEMARQLREVRESDALLRFLAVYNDQRSLNLRAIGPAMDRLASLMFQVARKIAEIESLMNEMDVDVAAHLLFLLGRVMFCAGDAATELESLCAAPDRVFWARLGHRRGRVVGINVDRAKILPYIELPSAQAEFEERLRAGCSVVEAAAPFIDVVELCSED